MGAHATPKAHRSDSSSALALAAYEALAPFYDTYTSDFEYDAWLTAVEQWAREHGLTGRRLLDVACGTGKSFEPMLARGYVVSACDLSPAMVRQARRRAGGDAHVRVADMRALPWKDQFDLITCMDDGLNYMLSRTDLEAALQSMAAALRPGGFLVFDTNTLKTYRTTFAKSFEASHGQLHFRWRGETSADFRAGGRAQATIEVTTPERKAQSHHVERHWPITALKKACASAGLERVRFRGQRPGGRLLGDPDEDSHVKVICLAARSREGVRA